MRDKVTIVFEDGGSESRVFERDDGGARGAWIRALESGRRISRIDTRNTHEPATPMPVQRETSPVSGI